MLVDTADSRLLVHMAVNYSAHVVNRVALYTEHANDCLYIPAHYSATSPYHVTQYPHYHALADLRDALALELL